MMKVNIDGMSCGHCVGHIREALETLSGVTKIEVKLDEKAAYVEGTVSDETVRVAIEEAGYNVISIED